MQMQEMAGLWLQWGFVACTFAVAVTILLGGIALLWDTIQSWRYWLSEPDEDDDE